MDTGEPAMRDAGADPGSRLGAAAGPGAGTGAAGEPQPRQPLRNDATDQPALVEVASERARRAAAVTGRATARAGKAAGRATAGASKATAKGVVVGAKFMGRGAKAGTERFRLFARSEGAAESGLSRVTEMQVLASAGDAAFTVALASTILALPLGQARGQVALFLVTTMAPFVVLAPLVGPLLDRWRHGRRWAIGTTLALRAFLSWVLAGVVADGSPWLLPLALLCLMATRAYAVALSAGIPLVRPDAISLVTANSRQSVATLMGMLLGAAVAAPIGRFGAPWSLRVAFLIYIGATVLAIRLPAAVDSQRTPPPDVATESPPAEPPSAEPPAAETPATEP
ncbi:MAG TPA: MFS transporter, partial [Dermatophilaceae bacterium]|nr:MFS transporter [Dermatophilaceae bacterium]